MQVEAGCFVGFITTKGALFLLQSCTLSGNQECCTETFCVLSVTAPPIALVVSRPLLLLFANLLSNLPSAMQLEVAQ